MKNCVVCCDFDGTICIPDSVEFLLEKYAPPKWKDLDKLVWQGRMSERAAMTEQVSMITAGWEAARDALIRGVRVREGFAEFVEFCDDRGILISILSSGLRPLIAALLEAYSIRGLDIRAHDVRMLPASWEMVPYPGERLSESCSHCKCVDIESFKRAGNFVIYVGDGYTDICPSAHADLLFATDALATECNHVSRPFCFFETFHDIQLELVSRL